MEKDTSLHVIFVCRDVFFVHWDKFECQQVIEAVSDGGYALDPNRLFGWICSIKEQSGSALAMNMAQKAS